MSHWGHYSARYLGDANPNRTKRHVHDLANEQPSCTIHAVEWAKNAVTFSTRDEAYAAGFDPCIFCLPYERGADWIPRAWIARIKESMKTILPQFNTNRMVRDYTEKFYLESHRRHVKFSEHGFRDIRELSKWKETIGKKWKNVHVTNLVSEDTKEVTVGSQLRVQASINLGDLAPENVNVELYFGSLNPAGEIVEGAALPMFLTEQTDGGECTYEGRLLCLRSGQFGYTVRVIPSNPNMVRKFEPNFIAWG